MKSKMKDFDPAKFEIVETRARSKIAYQYIHKDTNEHIK